MKDTYDFTYAGDLRHFIGVLLDDYCPTQLKIFDSDIVYDVIKDLKQFDVELTGDQIFEDCCLECNALLNKDLQQLKEDFSYTDMEELSEYEKETVKEFLDAYNGNYNLIDYECNGNASSIWIRKDLTSNEIEVCRIIDKHFDVFKNLEDRVDIDLFNIRKEEISTERNEIEEDLDEIEMKVVKMEKRFTSSNKRIVEFCNLMESVKLKHMIDARILILEDVTSLGSLYISQDKTRQLLNEYLKPYRFEISKDYTSLHNIGNNHKYDVIDCDVLDNVETHIGHLSINNLMGYNSVMFIEDMDEKRIGSKTFELTKQGLLTRENERWIGWDKYIQEKHLDWNLNDLEKEQEIRSLVRQCIEEEILQVENGYIMVIRETTDGNTVWTLATYEQVIEDLKNEKQFQVFKDALQQKQQLKEKQESQSKKQVYQQSLKDMQEVYDKIEKFNKEHKAPLGTEKYEYELYAYMKQNGLYVHLYEEYENGEFLKDFDYGLVTGTIYGYPDKELRLSESFEIWGKDGEYFGAYSKKDVMTKLDGLDAKQQEKTQSIDEEKDLELDEFEK